MGTPTSAKRPGKTDTFNDSLSMAQLAAQHAEEKKGIGTIILDVRKVTLLTDFFVITGGTSTTQVKAIADAITEALAKHGCKPTSIEGIREGRWVLLDFGGIIVHILQDKERNHYKLEQFWNQALVVDRTKWASK